MRAEKRAEPPKPYEFKNPYEISRTCIVTSKKHTIIVEREDWDTWTHGKSNSVTLFHYLPEGMIELLVSHLSPEGHQILFRGVNLSDGEDDIYEELISNDG